MEVRHADGLAVDGVVERVFEIGAGPFVDDEHALALALRTAFVIGEFALLYFDVVLLGKVAQGFGESHLLGFHDEMHGIASLAAAEAVAGVAGRGHGERRCALVVEGAQALVVGSGLVKSDEIGHHVYNLRGFQNAFYGCWVYHLLTYFPWERQIYIKFRKQRKVLEERWGNRGNRRNQRNRRTRSKIVTIFYIIYIFSLKNQARVQN